MKKLLIFIAVILPLITGAQSPVIKWQKCFGGSGSDHAYWISKANDGNFLIGGDTGSNDGEVSGNHGGADFWVLKIDTSGSIIWDKILGGNTTDWIHTFIQTSDGGYIASGYTHTDNDGDVWGNHGGFDFWIVKLDSLRNIEWQHCYGGSCDETDSFIEQTADGGYIITGTAVSVNGDVVGNHATNCSQRDFWVIKTDGSGNIQWKKCYGGTGDEYANSIIQTTDGGFIVAGNTESSNGDVINPHIGTGVNDLWVVKLDTAGNITWSKCYGGSVGECAYSIKQTPDGGYIFTGSTASNDGDVSGLHTNSSDIWTVKTDSAGTIQWQKVFGGWLNENAYSVELAQDGGYIVAGWTESSNGDVTGYHGGRDGWVIKLDSGGNMQWQKAIGGTGEDAIISLVVLSKTDYLLSGYTKSSDGDVIGSHGNYDYWVVRLSDSISGIREIKYYENLIMYPNPATDRVFISTNESSFVEIRNLQGILQVSEKINSEQSIDVSNLSKGVYFVSISSEKGVKTSKLIVE